MFLMGKSTNKMSSVADIPENVLENVASTEPKQKSKKKKEKKCKQNREEAPPYVTENCEAIAQTAGRETEPIDYAKKPEEKSRQKRSRNIAFAMEASVISPASEATTVDHLPSDKRNIKKTLLKSKKRKRNEEKSKHAANEPSGEVTGLKATECIQEVEITQKRKRKKKKNSEQRSGLSDSCDAQEKAAEPGDRIWEAQCNSKNLTSENAAEVPVVGEAKEKTMYQEGNDQKGKKRKKNKQTDELVQASSADCAHTSNAENDGNAEILPVSSENVVDEKGAVDEVPVVNHSESAAFGKSIKDDPRNERTLFVGNVSQDADQKDIKKLFKQFGRIESVRIRGVIPVNPQIPKRAALLSNRLAPFSDSFQAYVVFKESEDVAAVIEKACKEMNMSLFKDRHIRVMRANYQRSGSRNQSLFIGNLPFDCSEEDVIRTFQEIAVKLGVEIVGARVNRDGDTGMGRGIGFVTFNDSLGVQGCMNAEGDIKIGGRVIRMEPADKKKKLNTKHHKKHLKASNNNKSTQLYWKGVGSSYMSGKTSSGNRRQNARIGGNLPSHRKQS